MKKVFIYSTSEKYRKEPFKDIDTMCNILSKYSFVPSGIEKSDKIFTYSCAEDIIFIIVSGKDRAKQEIEDLMSNSLKQLGLDFKADTLYLMLHSRDFNVAMERRIPDPGPYRNFGGFANVNVYIYQHEVFPGTLLHTIKSDYSSCADFVKSLENKISGNV